MRESREVLGLACSGSRGEVVGSCHAAPGPHGGSTNTSPTGHHHSLHGHSCCNSRLGLGGLQVGLDVLVLRVEVGHVDHQVLKGGKYGDRVQGQVRKEAQE